MLVIYIYLLIYIYREREKERERERHLSAVSELSGGHWYDEAAEGARPTPARGDARRQPESPTSRARA